MSTGQHVTTGDYNCVCQQGSTYQLVIAADLTKAYAFFVYNSVNVDVLIPDVFNGLKAPGGVCHEYHATSLAGGDIMDVLPSSTSAYTFDNLEIEKL
jgi:hypothetical protein